MSLLVKRLQKSGDRVVSQKGTNNAKATSKVENEIGDKLRRLSKFCFSVTVDYPFVTDDMVLRFGNSKPPPIDSLDDTHFADSYKRLLIHSLNVRKPLPLQRHIWPLVAAGFSLCCIAGQRSGKSYSYLVPIMARLMHGTERVTSGPLVVIICSCHKTANALFREVIKLRGHKRFPRAVIINSFAESIGRQKYEIVISTPSPLLRLIEKNVIRLENCLFLILDEGDKTLELHLEAVKEIYSHYASSSQNRYNERFSFNNHRRELKLKTLIFAEKWTENVEKFKKIQYRPVVLFGTYFEALIANKAKCGVELVDNDANRKVVLHRLVNSRLAAEVESIFIMCCNMNEAVEVLQSFSQTTIVATLIDEKTHIFDTRITSKGIVLVVVDEHIPVIRNINDIQCLIHYNLPTTKGVFNNRFRFAKQKLEIDANESSFESFIILSKSNRIQIHQLYNFLKRSKLQIPVEVELLRDSVSRELCRNYVSVGFCKLKNYSCFLRHSFKYDEEADSSLPTDGQIKGYITSVTSPNEVYMQINELRNETSYKWKKVNRHVSRENFEMELNKLKMKKSHYIANVKTGEIYAVLIKENIYRVKVINTVGDHFRLKLNLFHIDFGHYSTCTSKDLIPLPEFLKNVPPFVNKVYVWGIKPVDNEIEWYEKCTQKFSDVINGQNVQFITAWILKQVNGEFWVNEMRAVCKLPHVGPQLITLKLTESMIDGRFAERNQQQLPNFNSSREYTLSKWKCDVQQLMIRKAFLADECTEVYLTNFTDVNELYVQHVKFIDCLQRLEKDLNASDAIRRKIEHFFVGLVCICFHESKDSYNRAQIEATNEDDTVKVFFVDYGDKSTIRKDNCFQIEDKFIATLPFQAIRCELSGLKGRVQPNVVGNFTRDGSVLKSTLASKVSIKEGINVVRLYVEEDAVKRCRNYKSLGKCLVDNGFANYVNDDEKKAKPVISLKINEICVSDNDDEADIDRLKQLEMFLRDSLCEKKESEPREKKVESRAQKLRRAIKKYEKMENKKQSESDESEATPYLPDELHDLSNLPESAIDFEYAKDKDITTVLPFEAADIESSNESEEDDLHYSNDSLDA